MVKNFSNFNVLFTLALKFLKEKNVLDKFLKDSYRYHSLSKKEYELPLDLSPREKTLKILGHNVNLYLNSYRFKDLDYEPFSERISEFFVTYDGSFEWCTSDNEDLWFELNQKWTDTFLPREIKKLRTNGLDI